MCCGKAATGFLHYASLLSSSQRGAASECLHYGRGVRRRNPHVIENCLIQTGQGVWVDDTVDNFTFQYNLVQGWPFWGSMGAGYLANFPQYGSSGDQRGWFGYNEMEAGVWSQGGGR